MTEQEQRKVEKMKLRYREQILDLQKFVKMLFCVIAVLVIVIAGLIVLLILPEKGEQTEGTSGNQVSQEGNTETSDADGTKEEFELDYVETDRYEITRNDVIVSIRKNMRVSIPEEGVGFSYQEAITYDAVTGLVLSLDDLLSDKEGFYEVVDALIIEQLGLYPEMPDLCPKYKEIYQEEYIEKEQLPCWFFREDGMAFSFEDEQFLGGAYAIIEITVPYEKLSDYIKSEYLPKED